MGTGYYSVPVILEYSTRDRQVTKIITPYLFFILLLEVLENRDARRRCSFEGTLMPFDIFRNLVKSMEISMTFLECFLRPMQPAKILAIKRARYYRSISTLASYYSLAIL